MALKGILNNRAGQTPNNNIITAFGNVFGAFMTRGSWENGCPLSATTPTPDGFVNIGTGHIVFKIAEGSCLVFYNEAVERLAVNPNPNVGTTVNHLVYAKLNLEYDLGGLPTATFEIAEGVGTTDPELPNNPAQGIFCVPLGRVAKTYSATGIVTSGEIVIAGNTNNSVPEPVRPISVLNGSLKYYSQSDVNSMSFIDGNFWYNTTNKVFQFFNGIVGNLNTSSMLWQLTSPLAMGEYAAASSVTSGAYNPVPRTSPNTVFTDYLNSATGTGSLVIPANSLNIGDKIKVRMILTSVMGASGAGRNNGYANLFKLNGAPLSSGGVSLRTLAGCFSNQAAAPINRTQGGFYDILNNCSNTFTAPAGLVVVTPLEQELEIISIGASGKATFKIHGVYMDAPSTGANGNALTTRIRAETSDNVLLGICDINTNISNTINFDFNVFKSSSDFAPTITLNNLWITKN